MSEVGAFANMYEKYKELCQLVNNVLLDVNMNRSSTADVKRIKLKKLFEEILNSNEMSIDANWGKILLDDINYNSESIKKILDILSGDHDQYNDCWHELENLAGLLESQRTKMYAKMRGV